MIFCAVRLAMWSSACEPARGAGVGVGWLSRNPGLQRPPCWRIQEVAP